MKARIQRATRELLAAHAAFKLVGAEEQPDGSFEIDLDDDVAERLAAISPDVDEAIRTVCSNHTSGRPQ